MSASSSRIAGLDIARGLAIYLMFQSHTVKGLLFFRDMPDWGVHPMHTLTKFSSSLFVIVFGVTLGLIFSPRTERPGWSATRNHLWWRAVIVMFWYKVLTVVQTFQTRPRDVITDMLLFKKFPDFVEILDFYAWLLLLLPLALPLWRRLPVWVTPLSALLLAGLGQLLFHHFDFFGVAPLKAILVEDTKLFCFGVLTRGPLAMLGIFLGDLLSRSEAAGEEFGFDIVTGRHWLPADRDRRRRWIASLALVAGALLLVVFFVTYRDVLHQTFINIARNRGKHPPATFFMTFSVGGSLMLLGACLMLPPRGFWLLKPFEVLGRESLACFVWHIVLIFVGYRWLFELKRVARTPQVSYTQALLLTGLVTLSALGVAWLNTRRKRWQAARREQARSEADFLDALDEPDTLPDGLPPAALREARARHEVAEDSEHDRIIKDLLS